MKWKKDNPVHFWGKTDWVRLKEHSSVKYWFSHNLKQVYYFVFFNYWIHTGIKSTHLRRTHRFYFWEKPSI